MWIDQRIQMVLEINLRHPRNIKSCKYDSGKVKKNRNSVLYVMSKSLNLSECDDVHGVQAMVFLNSKSYMQIENVRNLWLYSV